MELREGSAGAVTVLEIQGRVDSGTAPTLGERLIAALAGAESRLVVDFKQVEYVSSAGFRVLLLAARRADQAGGRLVLCELTAKVRQLFDLGGFLDLFAISASREDGIAAAQ